MLKLRQSWRISTSLYSSASEAVAFTNPVDALYRRISRAGDPSVSVIPIIDQFVEQGGSIVEHQIKRIIKELRKYRRFKHALEISEWMSKKRHNGLMPGDLAVQLDLISKVHGLKQAEEYYESIPDGKRSFELYSSLLNCYASNKCVHKAEDLMQKMKDLGHMRRSLSYNVMLNMYSKMHMYEKLDILMQEMKETGIEYDTYTYTIRLNAYASAFDNEGMEKLLRKMEVDPFVVIEWNWYVTAANGYLIAGQREKALNTLRQSEQLITYEKKRNAYEILMGLYTKLGDKDDLYRIWILYRGMNRYHNSGYLIMISSLGKLGEISGVEKIYKDWDLGSKTCFDIRVPNTVISVYVTHGHLERAKAVLDGLIQEGKDPNASSWERLALGYHMRQQMEEAADSFKNALQLPRPRPWWKPNDRSLAGCLNFLIHKGDLEKAEEIVNLLKERGYISVNSWSELLGHIRAEKAGLVTFDNYTVDGDIEDSNSKPLSVELL
uniref:Pentatricopeptide repeat-containing protein n=1 Tax=Kalanchoe fedtschenkoi TaxID=63787 RepID=A0A7N1A1I5_KALFE